MKWVLSAALVVFASAAAAERTRSSRSRSVRPRSPSRRPWPTATTPPLQRFIAEDSVFFGRSEAFRGKAAVVASWKQLYEGPHAPFS